jgi:type I restriction-modification system DNA methylase subunit
MANIDTFTSRIRELITNFERDLDYFLSKQYLEAEARLDFINPFFDALGWDIANKAGLRHDQREVVVEKGESEMTGRPDYSFRVEGRIKFFVEAKAPSEPLSAVKNIMQAKSYAWSTREVFFVVLTDFGEFRFYDASIKPDERNPDEGLLVKLTFREYLENADKLWEFSKERVAAGSLDAMLPRGRRVERLRIPVDQAFLGEMTQWRADLAKDIYKNNPHLTARQLNEVVQRLLDRIVFIRIAEDRRIIEKRQLADAVDEWKARGGKFDISEWLHPLFGKINEDFNGEIFKPSKLLEETKASSEVLARIIERLYPPKSPYRFDVIGVELLGSIYERYLGNTIRTTARQVRVEEKPEVRHAGGVYYTPKYIVDYIVKETLGKTISGKTPRQVEKVRIVDPACGSGSFLVGAFQHLIEYHIQYFTEHPAEARVRPLFPDVIKDETGEARLSVTRKARILRNNLFGVDIDPQAAEITMMSLYLKALEGEKSQLPPKQSLLPELKYNIMCGNSLIGPNIYDQGTLFGDAEKDRINAFDWQSAFPEIMKSGGFDVVIGNPPYIRVQVMQEWAPFEVEFYKRQYKAASSGNYDIYVVFVEKGLSLLQKGGVLGFILPHKFFNAKYGEPLRSLIAEGKHLSEIVHFGDQQVFEGATNYTCLLFLEKDGKDKFQFAKVDNIEAWRNQGKVIEGTIPAARATDSEWNFAVGKSAALFEKLAKMPVKLGDVADIFVGLQTSADDVFIMELVEDTLRTLRLNSKILKKVVTLEKDLLHPLVSGTDVRRYGDLPERQYILFPYTVENGVVDLIDLKTLSKTYPRTAEYLAANRSRLQGREHGRMKGAGWYGYIYLKNMAKQSVQKLCVPRLVEVLHAALDREGTHFLDNVDVGGVTPKPALQGRGLIYLLGLLNSTLLRWYFPSISAPFRGGWRSANRQFLSQLPIRSIDFSETADKARHDKMVTLVERMLELNKKKHSGKLAPSQLEQVERDIGATDAKIDDLVYELYGITDEERQLIEETPSNAATQIQPE